MLKSPSDRATTALIKQIKLYSDTDGYKDATHNIDVVQSQEFGYTPKMPYITVDVIEPRIQKNYSIGSSKFDMRVQLQVVSDNRKKFSLIKDYLYKVFSAQLTNYELIQQNMGIRDIENVDTTSVNADNANILSGGIDLLIGVHDDYDDFTEPGILETNETKIERNDK